MEARNVLLEGEGRNRHVLYGQAEFSESVNVSLFPSFKMVASGILRHEDPLGSSGEHQSLAVSTGEWSMGRQVESNPFHFGSMERLTSVWD